MEKLRYMISDAAHLVNVESHVLRYWEDELDLEIPRNEMGHRYYTKENIRDFQKIKDLKDQGYQLKAIRMILHNGHVEEFVPLPAGQASEAPRSSAPTGQAPEAMQKLTGQASEAMQKLTGQAPEAMQKPMGQAPAPETAASPPVRQQPVPTRQGAASLESADALQPHIPQPDAEERMAQFRELMSDIVGRAIAANNEELSQWISTEVGERVLKEMDYLFREQEDAQEERYRKLDAAIRQGIRGRKSFFKKKKEKKQ